MPTALNVSRSSFVPGVCEVPAVRHVAHHVSRSCDFIGRPEALFCFASVDSALFPLPCPFLRSEIPFWTAGTATFYGSA